MKLPRPLFPAALVRRHGYGRASRYHFDKTLNRFVGQGHTRAEAYAACVGLVQEAAAAARRASLTP